MSERRVEVHDHEIAYDGYFRIERYRLSHSLHNGGMSKPLIRELFERGPCCGRPALRSGAGFGGSGGAIPHRSPCRRPARLGIGNSGRHH